VKVQADLLGEIEEVGVELRSALVPVLQKIAGQRPRPTQLTRALGLDKSLASRLVRAANARTDLDLMHLVPSPAGLRILSDSAGPLLGKPALSRLNASISRLQRLIDSAPGGRATLDARISESSDVARDRRERIARQSSFKSMSFLIGYYSDFLSTSLFVVPSDNGRSVDGIEINRRIGIRRLRPNTPLPILSYTPWRNGTGEDEPTRFDSIEGSDETPQPSELLLSKYSGRPLPRFEVVQDPGRTTVVLPADPGAGEIDRLTWAFRLRNGGPIDPGPGLHSLGGYLLHMPCRRLVRDIFIAEDVYPEAVPRVSFVLPDLMAHLRPPHEPGISRFGDVHVSASFEELPRSARAHSIPGVADHGDVTREVLERAGHSGTRFRGWRCEMTYPAPLVQMMLWFWLPHSASYEKW
jgi:hypothetical protein